MREVLGTSDEIAPQAPETLQHENGPEKPWRRNATIKLTKAMTDGLYTVRALLRKETSCQVGLIMEIPVFIKDPLVAMETPALGIDKISVRLEAGMGDGPTSSRIAVVDWNGDTQTLLDPVKWDEDERWFRVPPLGDWISDAPDSRKAALYREFIKEAIRSPHFHQVNVWAVVQRVLEFYEAPQALGRPIPWGFDGNRLIVVPHAGHGENAFYDGRSKSLQFYYFGDRESPGYTCLSHDVVAHETGHAVLDGIRPMYNQLSSVQTAAFHEFIGDLTAILLALDNRDLRAFISKTSKGTQLQNANLLADLARQFGEEVAGRPYLRSAINLLTMQDVAASLSPHNISQVLTGAMFDILMGIVGKHLQANALEETSVGAAEEETEEETTDPAGSANGAPTARTKVSMRQALNWTSERFRRVALQPLDLCPPCDIQFIDYARAVVRNDVLTNPVDPRGYRQVMLDVFHRRGLCTCSYESGKDLPHDCLFREALRLVDLPFVRHDIGRVARSRTAAYYFLSDNRALLHIPAHQDVRVVDLYDNSKFGVGAERLPREVVLEYAWQEEVILRDDPERAVSFGKWNGKTFNLDCGGTLVFDDRGNLLSWFRKPGTQHMTEAREQLLRERKAAWDANPAKAKGDKIKPLNRHEREELKDLEIGRQRVAVLLSYLSDLSRRDLIGEERPGNGFSDGLKPVTAIVDGDVLRLEIMPQLRKNDFDTERDGWTANY